MSPLLVSYVVAGYQEGKFNVTLPAHQETPDTQTTTPTLPSLLSLGAVHPSRGFLLILLHYFSSC